MTIRKILLPLSGGDDDVRLGTVALQLGESFGAQVEFLHPAIDPRDAVAFVGEGMTAAMIEQIVNAAEQEGASRASRARSLYDRLIRDYGAGAKTAYVERSGPEDDVVAEAGRLADLIIVARPGAEEGPTPVVQACLKDTGRPVLVLPPKTTDMSFGKKAIIAWNGSIEAGRALKGALPFLARAEQVEVLSVKEGTPEGPRGGDVVDYLRLCGITASSRDLPLSGGHAGQAVMAAVGNCDLLVMGAYSRSHMRRLIFGGVTAEVLARAEMPVLMSH